MPLAPLTRVRLAVDAMGGDHGASVTIPAVRRFLQSHPDAEVLLVGLPDALGAASGIDRCRIVSATEVVAMDDPVDVALRRKKDSSMRVAITQLKADEATAAAADACVSAGNTGALMAIARYVLKTLPGIDRPAIAAALPNVTGGMTTMLDLGANVDCSAEHLLQFAVLGSALVSATQGREQPTVGLLNIGEELIKGSETIKRAGELLRQAAAAGQIQFLGNVEGNDIFKGTADIVVCDGFVGNVALKASEGLASMMSQMIRQEFSRSLPTRLAALLAMPVLNRFKARVDHRRYGGGALLGLRGVVFKAHGSSDAFAFENAMVRAYDAARNRLLDRLRDRVTSALAATGAVADAKTNDGLAANPAA
ncbi:MAG: phosphate acyltransferase PlsX [Aquabacterium sp.]